jgi:hypothetical protein
VPVVDDAQHGRLIDDAKTRQAGLAGHAEVDRRLLPAILAVFLGQIAPALRALEAAVAPVSSAVARAPSGGGRRVGRSLGAVARVLRAVLSDVGRRVDRRLGAVARVLRAVLSDAGRGVDRRLGAVARVLRAVLSGAGRRVGRSLGGMARYLRAVVGALILRTVRLVRGGGTGKRQA